MRFGESRMHLPSTHYINGLSNSLLPQFLSPSALLRVKVGSPCVRVIPHTALSSQPRPRILGGRWWWPYFRPEAD